MAAVVNSSLDVKKLSAALKVMVVNSDSWSDIKYKYRVPPLPASRWNATFKELFRLPHGSLQIKHCYNIYNVYNMYNLITRWHLCVGFFGGIAKIGVLYNI